MKMNADKKKEIVTLVVVFAGVLLVSAFVVYLISGKGTTTPVSTTQAEQPATITRDTAERRTPTSPAGNESIIDRLFGTRNNEAAFASERWVENVGRLFVRLLLAALLGAALAFRPRKRILAVKRNPYAVSYTHLTLPTNREV